MLTRLALRTSRLSSATRFFSDNKPPKGFEKFFKKKKPKEEHMKTEPPDEGSGPWGNFNMNPKRWPFLSIFLAGAASMYSVYTSERQRLNTVTFQELVHEYVIPRKATKLIVEVSQKDSGTSALHNIYVLGHEDQVLGIVKVPDLNLFLSSLESEQTAESIDPKEFIPVEFRERTAKEASEYLEYLFKATHHLINVLLLGGLVYMVYRISKGGGGQGNSGGGGGGFGDMFNISKANFKVYGVDNKKINVSFADVAGLPEAKKEIMEFVDFLKSPRKFRELGARIPRGALLVGPPGTGKTLLAKAVAGEAAVPFFSISGSDFVEMFVGVGASRVRQLFRQARERAPSIIFIDEIDAVGRKRHGRIGGNDERDNTLNQLLVELDGFGTDSHVVVLAGTNRTDVLDSALLRPGRFDRNIELTLPDLDSREEILKIHLRPITLNTELKLGDYAKRLAALSPGFSGADLANLCNEAAIIAARKDKDSVDKDDFENASERILGGLEKEKKLSARERNIVAYHESGHAVAGWFLQGADPVLKVSILPRSKGALGFSQFLPNETMLYSKNELFDKICMTLGGRVAEELFIGKVTTGAQDDLQRATSIAQAVVSSFGMNETLGVIGYNMDQEAFNKPFSEDTGKIIDEEVRAIVAECLERTRKLLAEKRDLVEKLALRLLEKERVTQRDLVEVLGKRPFAAQPEYQRYLDEDDPKE